MNKAKLQIILSVLSFAFLPAQNKFYEENFAQNLLKWETGKIENSESYIDKNVYVIKSENSTGTTRFIRSPYGTSICNISCEMDISQIGKEHKAGIIFGYRSWRDYQYFVIDKKYVYIGTVSDNIVLKMVDGVYLDKLSQGKNTLQVIYEDTRAHYYVNGVLIFETKILQNKGDKLGFVVTKNDLLRVSYFKISQTSEKSRQNEVSEENSAVKNFGCGLLFPREGYVITCNTNLDFGEQILVDVHGKVYAAKKEFVNDILDLALIKLDGFEAGNFTNPVLSLRPIKPNDSLRIVSYKAALSQKSLHSDDLTAGQLAYGIPQEASVINYRHAPELLMPGSLWLNNEKQIVGMSMRKKDRAAAFKNSDLLAFIDGSGIQLDMSQYTSASKEKGNQDITDFLVLIRTR